MESHAKRIENFIWGGDKELARENWLYQQHIVFLSNNKNIPRDSKDTSDNRTPPMGSKTILGASIDPKGPFKWTF